MIIGTAGHIDHGKTSLVRALTGVETDRLKEEKARGISIDLGFAYLPDADGSVLGFVDVPGHERFIHNMLAGATGIDFVMLVVAADDGIKPQTREHLAIIDLLGIERGVVALTKTDLIDIARQQQVAKEIAEILQSTRLAGARIVPVSIATGEGVAALRTELLEIARQFGAHAANGRFRLAVDRSFTLTGAGTVVTGTVLSGAVAVDDRVTISPSGLVARVRSIHAQNRPSPRGTAGQRCALNLAGDGISKDAIARGDVVLDPVLHAPSNRIDAELRWLASEPKPVVQWMPVRLFHAAAETGARIVLLEDRPIAPGQSGLVQLVLEQPIAAASGDRFVLRDTTGQRTIGGGRLLDLRAPSRKRGTPMRLAQLQAQAQAVPAAALATLLEIAPHHVDLPAFARDRALSDAQTQDLVAQLSLVTLETPQGSFAMAARHHLALKQSLLGKLQAFHADNPDLPGIGLERLRLQLEPRLPAPALLAVLHALVRGREIALDGAWVRLAGHEVRLTDDDELLWARLAPLLSGAERFRPPRVRDIANLLVVKEQAIRRLLKLLGRMGRVDEVAHDHFFLRGTVAEMVGIVVRLGDSEAHAEFTASQFRDQMDNGRKVAIQILEFFDRHGVTIRRGDLRRVNRHRLDLFRPSQDAPRPAAVSGGESSPVGRPDFKSGRGRETVSGGFDSLSLPPR
ncbi:selenocysteine-specific translation elongation factor [Tardiphaga sp. vice352]|nr:selenocysteine-specific translation elongation factor [Tardiphaga sp. vice278]QDM20242.1 selenocysteine-specific translation elongation factor [Tardiphaga sp. vice154]QDM30528.1 selenocysteine-specific translation elongation factor [Tardiphaga sp. vice352]